MTTDNITLIGMPGAGKSTVGVVLAKVLGMEFLDSDLLIQRREKKLLWQIIEQEGNAGFARIEDEVNSAIEAENTIIATGGSVVYGEQAMQHLKEISTVVYLKVSLGELERRLGDLKNRGVTMKDGQTLASLYEERSPLYEKYADITIDMDAMDVRETVDLVIQKMKSLEKPVFRVATEADVPLILHFIKELASYEKMLDEVVATEEILREWIFEKNKAEVIFVMDQGKEAGFALFFHNFSTFLGRSGIYLEDLYVMPEYRGKGYGKALLKELARIAVERGCGRLEWWCLDWNQPSIDFYLSLGAEPMKDWTVYRIAGETLHNLAR